MYRPILTALALATLLPAQAFFIPDADASTGTCNVFPFGSTGGQNVKYQQIVTAAELGNQPGVITGMGFAQCGEGVHHFDTIEVLLDHKATATLASNFAQNLSGNAVTVVAGTNYDWNLPANSWQDVGLQNYFAYNGVDNLVVQVTVTGSQWTSTGSLGSPGLRAGSHPRVYASGWTAAPPAVGTLAPTFALKIELDMGLAKVSSYGRGCAGSNALAPKMAVAGIPQLAQTVTFGLADALPNTLGVLIFGLGNSAPYPADLGVIGMPGCLLYQDLFLLTPQVCDPLGSATSPLTLPANPALTGERFYAQWASYDASANAFGWTISNYVRVQIGL